MKNRNLQLLIPADISEKLSLKGDDKAILSVRNNKLIVEFQENQSHTAKNSFIWPIIIALITSIVFYIYCIVQNIRFIKLVGNSSLATAIIILGAIIGTILFTFFFIIDRKNPHNEFAKNVYWRNFPVIVISFALILALCLVSAMWLLGVLFKGAMFDNFTASIILFVFCTIINLFMIHFALIIDGNVLSTVLTLVIISGVAISMAVNNRRYWWQHNLSFLGTNQASSGWQFNATLILSAFLMLALIDYLFVSLHNIYAHTWKLWLLRVLLTMVAINLALVGVFPNDASFHNLHDHVAFFLIYFVLILIIGIRWLLPAITKEFIFLSYAVGISLIVSELLFSVVGYFSLTAFEIISFMLSFGWLLLVFNYIEGLIDNDIQSYIHLE
ncbi:DUF998 domain-containing protein [Liquorilactobacillus mali]|uniref:DUF998 domain-containing protein n=1 Tax=Liquorilactobacillus mali KCTC 3596 = DSM 20444 TaxID=1046596 RepID=J0L6M9_9LACO|nr:DUF998 domain-containing protein [Liquorilactobacillus mali]EJF00646.1 hypothetical protein LMA_03144 [Liquorilactobacillus mali KCTC 3596 = DSM 20444]KRN10151.1 hypothetical protein FD00_GL000386 [Liquorilactobacillus mali KCTC 3596 = DSM 20444]MDC7953021.1 DUF998 domain-containing protein [Liquorilactobacillus mali]MDV7757900.1 DUF998 domain-containing protein [Liquorilactobacillus mali]QFQ74025.1 DUF998 domain-containing protein [Liquorilactobacillus mali]